MNNTKSTKDWYENSYKGEGLNAQRFYPNNELLRFMGRNYFDVPLSIRKDINFLDIGCGSCSNLWMIASEGFDSHGVDISPKAIDLGHKMLDYWGVNAELKVSNMMDLSYPSQKFNVVIDVLSSYCLNEADFKICLSEISRVLKKNGRFFSYTPGKKSDAFLNHKHANLIDSSTLPGIIRKDSPFYGNNFPFRFIHPLEYRDLLEECGFRVEYLETVKMSYFNQKEEFEYVVVEAVVK